jgi:competence protein ComEA
VAGPNRTAVLAIALLALGAASIGFGVWQRQPGPALNCPPEQVRIGEDGVATCAEGAQPSAAQKLTLGAKIDLNRASEADLAAIDGVGPALAKALVSAREAQGGFKNWDEVDKVPGVGPARIEGLKAVTVLNER